MNYDAVLVSALSSVPHATDFQGPCSVLFAYYGQAVGAGLISLFLLVTSLIGLLLALGKQLLGAKGAFRPMILIGFAQTWFLVMIPWPVPISAIGWLLLISLVIQLVTFGFLFRSWNDSSV